MFSGVNTYPDVTLRDVSAVPATSAIEEEALTRPSLTVTIRASASRGAGVAESESIAGIVGLKYCLLLTNAV